MGVLPTNPLTGQSGPYSPSFINDATNVKNGNTAPYAPGYLASVGIPIPGNSPNLPVDTSGNATTPDTSYGAGNTSTANAPAPAPVYQDKSQDIAMQNAGLGSVDSTENTGVAAVRDALAKVMGQYSEDLASAKGSYGNESTTNQSDLQTNKQSAMEHAVQGRQGLYGTLASLGALGGTGIELANHAVEQGANEDLTTAANTYGTNQSGLDNSYNSYTAEEKRLEEQATSAGDNNEKIVHNNAAKARQAYLTNLANDYQLEGKTDQAKSYGDQAAALFPTISATDVPNINIGYSGGAYTAPTLSQYVGKANNTSVKTTAPATDNNVFNIPGLIAANKKNA